MNSEEKVASLTPEAVKVIEDILKRRNYVEVRIEDGSTATTEIYCKKRM